MLDIAKGIYIVIKNKRFSKIFVKRVGFTKMEIVLITIGKGMLITWHSDAKSYQQYYALLKLMDDKAIQQIISRTNGISVDGKSIVSFEVLKLEKKVESQ